MASGGDISAGRQTCLGLAELTGHADAESDGDRRGLSRWAHGWQRHRVGV